MAGTPLAEAYADLRLSDGKFTSDLVRIVARLKLAVSQMEQIAKVDVSATGTVRLNTAAAQGQIAQIRNDLTALGQIQSQLDVRTTRVEEAKVQVENLRTLLQGLNDNKIVVDPVVAAQEAESALARIQLLMAEISGRTVFTDVNVRGGPEAMVQLEALSLELERLDTEHATINVSATGVTKTKSELEALDATAQTAASDRGGMSNFEKRLILFTSTAALAGIFKLGESITKFGLTTSASLESIEVSFTNILGSAQVADQVFTSLKKFSVPAPFDTVVLAGVAKQLLAIGDTATQAVPDVKTLAGVVTLFANADPNAFGRLTLALGQIGSSTRPLAPDLRQITQAIPGFNAQLELAAGVAHDFGVTTDEAEKMIADGAIGGAQGMRILLEQMDRFPGAATAISTQALTLQGKFSNFKDTVKLNLADAFAGLANELKDALGPLADSVNVAFDKIGPNLAASLSTVLPTIGPLIEQLGAAFGPALGGFAVGIADTLSGLVPTLQVLLPALGQTFTLFGQFVQAIGGPLGETAGVLANVLIPTFETLNDVIGSIPTPVLTTLLTTLLAFRAVGFISGIFGDLALSLQKAELRAEGLTGKANRLKQATGDYKDAAKEATLAVAGFFSGLAAASDDAITKISGIAGSLASIAVATSINPWAGLVTATTSAFGFIVGRFEDGKRKAAELKAQIDTLSSAIIAALKLTVFDLPTLSLADIVKTDDFTKVVKTAMGKFDDQLVKEVDAVKAKGLLASVFTDQDLSTAATDSAQGLASLYTKVLGTAITGAQAKLIADIVASPQGLGGSPELNHRIAVAGGFDPATMSKLGGEGAEGVRKAIEAILGVPVNISPDLLNNIDAAFKTVSATAEKTADEVKVKLQTIAAQPLDVRQAREDIAALNELLIGFDQSAQAAAQALTDLAPKLDTSALPFATDAQNSAELNFQFDAMASGLERLNPLFDQFGHSLSVGAALDNVKKAVQGVKDTFDDLIGSLSASIAQQDLQFQLNNLGKSISELVGQDKFEAAQAKAQSLNDQIENQQARVADLKASLEAAQAKAIIDGADFDRRIAEAEKFGSVTGLAALRAARSQVGADADKAQRDLDEANRKITDMQGELAGLDLTTPQKLIDIVKGQAKAAGADLWQFLFDGPTKEAQQLYQDNLGSVIQKAFEGVRTIDATQGPQAAKDLVASLQTSFHDQLVAGGFSPGTADEIVKNMFHPDDLTKSLTDELNANLAAATVAGPTVNIGLSSDDVTKALEDLQKTLTTAPPLKVNFQFAPTAAEQATTALSGALLPPGIGEPTPAQQATTALAGVLLPPSFGPLDFADLDKQIAAHQATLTTAVTPNFDETDRVLANHKALLGSQVDPDFDEADRILANHNAPLAAVVAPDLDEADRILANHTATTNAVVNPDTRLLDIFLAQPHTLNVSLTAAALQGNGETGQLFLTTKDPFIRQREGGIVGFRGHHDFPHIAQIVPAGTNRVFAELETGGEGYVPLGPWQRERSTEIVRVIADMFGFRLEPKVTVQPNVNVNLPPAEPAQPIIRLSALMPSLVQTPMIRFPQRDSSIPSIYRPGVVQFDPKVVIGPTWLHGPASATSVLLERVRDLVSDRSTDRHLDRSVRETLERTIDRTSTFTSTLNHQLRSTVALMVPPPAEREPVSGPLEVDPRLRPLPGNMRLEMTAKLDDDRLVASVDRLVAVLTSPSSYTDRRARAEATGAVARLAEAILALDRTRPAMPRPEPGLRGMVDELTRMSR